MRPIRVGIIGMQVDRSWGAVAHVPALRALPDYEITAVSTTRLESAKTAAGHFGIRNAFDNHHELVASPDVDLVAVTVKVPHHLELVKAAIGAGKHVYCEWPLGNGLAEAEEMAALARDAGVTAIVGLQARFAPAIAYARDLMAEQAIGEILSTSLVGNGLAWSEYVDTPNAYLADVTNGATLLSIPVGHTMDAVGSLLGEVAHVSARLARRRTVTLNVDTNETIALTAPDQVAFTGELAGGTILSLHYRGGMSKGAGFDWRIAGTKGELRFVAANGHAQMADLTLEGAFDTDEVPKTLQIPDSYYHTTLRSGPALNVAEAYHAAIPGLRGGAMTGATFDDAIVRHEMIEAIERSAGDGTSVAISAQHRRCP